MTDEHVDVLIIGAGPAGLAAGRALSEHGIRSVLVIDRERQAGGVPRHCHHSGFGVRDLRRVLTGPRYADRLVQQCLAAGVQLRTETMATGWVGSNGVALTSPLGVSHVSADAVLLATGARERPRTARLIPGDRPEGVFTTGQLQQWWHQHRLPVGRRAIVVGAEHVSYSAALTLREAGVHVVALVTDRPRHQTFAAFAAALRWGLRVPVWTDTEVVAVHGHGRVRAVDLRNRTSGAPRSIAVDTVVFTGDWLPDNELARSGGLLIDGSSSGPVVDCGGATTADRVFAAGNVIHPGEPADVAALRGAAGGTALARRLASRRDVAGASWVGIEVQQPLQWSTPGRLCMDGNIDAAQLPRGLILRCGEFRRLPTILVEQEARLLGRYRLWHGIPNRTLYIPLDWVPRVEAASGPASIRIE
ncbi:MAG: NAD(P)/FAD-dependent oxidoreductase [Actinomycetota bacterium]|nr:NAD(P)/FAD-dependent oxidoreductase [Actinomycetota bacterium]